ncbi:hypothetical protein CDAR_40491 [Caerostris darwini]|uniref:Uncharacterized protein n=1 Tax=Caerostris darwini TaxID=1538125 RepID=A0AAV4RD21_9ARAC|nr:hypothetical protein CDAR_40491 [Caerostris darwini]
MEKHRNRRRGQRECGHLDRPRFCPAGREHWTEVTRCCRTSQQWAPGIHFPSIRNICWTDLEIEMGELTSNGVKGTFPPPLSPSSGWDLSAETDATETSNFVREEGGEDSGH